jgi:hypothetical protein
VSPRNELKTLENVLGGRDRLDFGTVRPRVQIPGPRPKSEYDDGIMAGAHGGAGSQPYHKLQPVYIEEFIPVSRSPQICRKTFPADTVPRVDRIDPTGMFEDAWNPTPQEIRSWAHTTAYAPEQDWELAVSDYPALLVELVDDPTAEPYARLFLLRALYILVGDVVRTGGHLAQGSGEVTADKLEHGQVVAHGV